MAVRESFAAQFRPLPGVALRPRPPGSSAVDLSLLIPAKNAAHGLKETVAEAHRYLSARFPGRFEIILIPTVPDDAASDPTPGISEDLSRRFDRVVHCPHHGPVGKGAALRTGFERARGKWVVFTDADLPYDLDFIERAVERLEAGASLVTGNRRLPSSRFRIPVELLSLAYGRHRLGLGFNRMVRALLPIRSSDTQAGIKAMRRELAEVAFSRLECPGFFFDLEIFLSARGRGLRTEELSVTLHLNTEKSTVRVLQQSVLAGYWLLRITWRHHTGYYRTQGVPA